MHPLISIFLLTSLGSIIALIGGVVFLSVKKWSRLLSEYSVPFAAGVLLTTSLIGLIPEATHIVGETAYTIVLISFLAAYLFELLFFDLHHHQSGENHKHTSSVPLIMIGDTIHNFIDGVAIATAYLINPGLGYATAISTFLHEVPHEIGDFGVMLHAGFSRRSVFVMNLISSCSALIGALMVYFWLNNDHFSGYLLSIASGMFLYLGASDFLPKAVLIGDKLKTILVFLTGVGLMFVTLTLIPHR